MPHSRLVFVPVQAYGTPKQSVLAGSCEQRANNAVFGKSVAVYLKFRIKNKILKTGRPNKLLFAFTHLNLG